MAPLVTLTITLASLLALGILHVLITVVIYTDANRIETGRFELQLAPGIWALAALIGGLTVLGIYWVMYHSTLRRDR